jgi:hypothetical protein
MTKNKWVEITSNASEEANNKLFTIHTFDPNNWEFIKNIYLNFIKIGDEATEVYNMENKD